MTKVECLLNTHCNADSAHILLISLCSPQHYEPWEINLASPLSS